MRRKPGHLLPLEVSILDASLIMRSRGVGEFHGFLIAKEVKKQKDARLLTAYGTLYKALDRLAKAGFLDDRWEDPGIAAQEHRPLRRLYQITVAGEKALAQSHSSQPDVKPRLLPRKSST